MRAIKRVGIIVVTLLGILGLVLNIREGIQAENTTKVEEFQKNDSVFRGGAFS